jgi:hypothetical protein
VTKKQQFTKRKGLEGPYNYPDGSVLYFDPEIREYWDPTTDFYVPDDVVAMLKNQFFDILSR